MWQLQYFIDGHFVDAESFNTRPEAVSYAEAVCEVVETNLTIVDFHLESWAIVELDAIDRLVSLARAELDNDSDDNDDDWTPDEDFHDESEYEGTYHTIYE